MLRIQKYDVQIKYVPGRTFLSLTLCQESAHVVMKPNKGLMYLCTRSIFNLIQAQ